MSDLMQTCNMDERTNEEKLLDNKIEALIYELCPNTSRAWIFDEDIPEKLRILIRTATLDECVEVVYGLKPKEQTPLGYTVENARNKAFDDSIKAIDNLRGNYD